MAPAGRRLTETTLQLNLCKMYCRPSFVCWPVLADHAAPSYMFHHFMLFAQPAMQPIKALNFDPHRCAALSLVTQLVALSTGRKSVFPHAGTVPFKDPSIMGLYDVIRTRPITFPHKPPVSAGLKDLISHMLCKDPSQRITLPQVMTHRWTTHNSSMPLQCRQVLAQLYDCLLTVR